jgi:hypothetical protein
MRASEFVVEKKKRKRRPRWAAYGPGPYGWYGYDAGYSGSSSDGGGGGGGGESVAEGFPQPGPSSGAPTQFAPGTQIQNQQMTAQQIISSIPGVPYYNNVVDDWDAKDYSWGVTKKVIEYAEYLKQHPESLAKLPPIQVVNGKFKDGAHRVSAIWLLQQRMDPKNPLWKNAKLNVQFVKQGVAEGRIKLYTDPGYFGAEVDDAGFDSLPVVNISADRLVGFEPDSKMNQPKSQANVKKIVAGLKKGDKLPPLLVRKYKNGYQVLDGHHRFWAYKLSGTKSIPVRIVADKDIEEISKPGVAEGTELPGDFKLMGQNLFLKNLARNLQQRYPAATVKLSNDRVTAHHNEEDDEALNVMGTEVMDSGYIGVGLDDAFTESFQGVLVPTIKQTTEQLLAANPGMQPALFLGTDNWNPDAWAHIAAKLGYRLVAGDEELDENFADGKGPGRPGDSQRHGIRKGASMAELEKAAKSKGRKGQLARWQLNMRRGKSK